MASKHDPTVTWKDLNWFEKYVAIAGVIAVIVVMVLSMLARKG